MNTKRKINAVIPGVILTVGLFLPAQRGAAETFYVNADNPTPQSPYDSWDVAAVNIQDAIDVASSGDLILVTNGVYGAGGRLVDGNTTNRVAVYGPFTIQSVNGPQFTVIKGRQVPGLTNAVGAIRGVYLADGAVLSGFTVTNGATAPGEPGGGILCDSTAGIVTNCIIIGNSADAYGGGVEDGTLDHCTLSTNTAPAGGGASNGTLTNCTLAGNLATEGGGAYSATLNNCTLSGNVAADGGGASESTLSQCTLSGNSATDGGGAYSSTLNNSTLSGNSADDEGGGSYESVLNNCTLTGNSSPGSGGGAASGTLNNCILYYNAAPDGSNYDSSSILKFSCTTPLPTNGTGNISLDPQLASASHLSTGSPCRGAGSAAYATGTDIDGEPWATPPSIGCDEYHAGAVTGPLSVSIAAAFTNVTVGYPLSLTALIAGRTTASAWDFGDGVTVSNWPCASHAWTAPGDYVVVLRAYNESHPEGVSGTATVHVAESVHYVAAQSTNPQPPYTSWATAATNIQDAIDVASSGDLILVTNGVYGAGGRLVDGNTTNRVAVYGPFTIQSVNGPQFTVIKGRQVPGLTNAVGAIRGVYLADGAVLSGFTVTNGATAPGEPGGGILCDSTAGIVTNCIIIGNSADAYGGGVEDGTLDHCTLSTNTAPAGGGASNGTLTNCTLAGNLATEGGGAYSATLNNCTLSGNVAADGGGASESTLSQCTLSGNSATDGGGAYYSTLNNSALSGNSASEGGGGACGSVLNNCTVATNFCAGYGGGSAACSLTNCIIYYNTAVLGDNDFLEDTDLLSYCCTVQQPTNGFGNITDEPLFVDLAGGNLRLQSNSPCINAGNNAYAPAGPDLDGNPRIVGGTVDIGAYEFQTPTSIISYSWLQQYGLPTDGSADLADTDGDGMNNWQEWICGTDPTNPLSALRLVSALPAGKNVVVTWQSVARVTYFLQWRTNLSPASPFMLLATNLPGQVGVTSFTHTNSTPAPGLFYRVGVSAL